MSADLAARIAALQAEIDALKAEVAKPTATPFAAFMEWAGWQWRAWDDGYILTARDRPFCQACAHDEMAQHTKTIARLISAVPDMVRTLEAHDAYLVTIFGSPDANNLHPAAEKNWRAIRSALLKAGVRNA